MERVIGSRTFFLSYWVSSCGNRRRTINHGVMEIIEGNIYDYPVYYDLVFGADWSAEYHFLKACFAKHVPGKTKRLFEPACGTGRLLYRFAKAGYSIGGLDLNPKAVAYCNERLVRNGLKGDIWVGDMCDFKVSRPYDAAFNTINSFRHLLTEKQAAQHLSCMAEAIRPGGIYALGLHLTPTEGIPTDTESWNARRGSLSVNTHMWPLSRDLKKRIERFGMRFDVYSPTSQFRINDELVLRSYTAKQFDQLLAKVPQWKIEAVYDFRYRIDAPIEIDPTVEDVVYILKRS